MLTRGLSQIECHQSRDDKQCVKYSCPRNDRRRQSEITQTVTNSSGRVYRRTIEKCCEAQRDEFTFWERNSITHDRDSPCEWGEDGVRFTVKMSYLRARWPIVPMWRGILSFTRGVSWDGVLDKLIIILRRRAETLVTLNEGTNNKWIN
jgi:hypothetical protein